MRGVTTDALTALGAGALAGLGVALPLVAGAARGLARLRRPRDAGLPAPRGRALRRFVALTAVNPMTAVYFVVLTAGLGHVVSGALAGTAFAAGVLLASCAWQ